MSDCVKAFEKKSGEDYSEWLGLKDLTLLTLIKAL